MVSVRGALDIVRAMICVCVGPLPAKVNLRMARILLLFTLVTGLVAQECPADFVTYGDSNLLASNWSHNVTGSGGFITGATTRVTPGIVGFPASHLTQLTGLNSQFIGIQYRARHIYTAQSFNIQSLGQPTQFNFNFWTNSQTGAVIFNALVDRITQST